MGMRLPTRWIWANAAALAAFAWAGPLRADLAASSPFLPANAAASGALAGPSGPIELRGVMATSEGASFCIYDTAKKKDFWVGLNETGHDFVVKAADSASDSVTVDYQGRSLHLVLHTAKVASSGSASAGPPDVRGGSGSIPRFPRPWCSIPRRRTSRGGWTPSPRRSAAGGWSAKRRRRRKTARPPAAGFPPLRIARPCIKKAEIPCTRWASA